MVRPFQSIDLPFGEQTINMRRGDTLPAIVARIMDEKREPYDLTGATVQLWVRRMSGIQEITGDWTGPFDCEVTDPTSGVIYYDLLEDDLLSNPGVFEMTARVTSISTGDQLLTAPTDRDVFLELRDDPSGDAPPPGGDVSGLTS